MPGERKKKTNVYERCHHISSHHQHQKQQYKKKEGYNHLNNNIIQMNHKDIIDEEFGHEEDSEQLFIKQVHYIS